MGFIEAGRSFFGRERWLEAAGCFRRALEKDEGGGSAAVYLAWCYARLGLPGRAVPLLAGMFRKEQQYAMCCLDLGRAWLEKKDSVLAARWFRAATRAWPDCPEAYLRLGELAAAAGDTRSAAANFARAAELDPRDHRPLLEMGFTLKKMGRLTEAFQVLGEAGRTRAAGSDADRARAGILRKTGDLPGAARILEELAVAHPRERDIYHQLGTVYEHLGDWGRMRLSFRRYLAFPPWEGDSLIHYLTALLSLGRYGDVVRAVRARPSASYKCWCIAAEARACGGDMRGCLELLEKASGKAASAFEKCSVLAWRGEIDLWRGDYRSAVVSLSAAVVGGARYAAAWLGAAQLLLGRLDSALRCLDRGIAAVPGDVEAFLWRGEARRLAGDLKGAGADLDHAVRFGGGMWARCNRALLRRALGDRAGMRRDMALIPPAVMRYARARTAGGAGESVLGNALVLARGVRRHEPYTIPLWMERL